MQEHRCANQSCSALLYKADGDLDVEVICPNCHRINYPAQGYRTVGLRGIAFQQKSVAIRDPISQKLLLRAIGIGKLEIKPKKSDNKWLFEISKVNGYSWRIAQNKVECLNLTPEQKEEQIKNKKMVAR